MDHPHHLEGAMDHPHRLAEGAVVVEVVLPVQVMAHIQEHIITQN
jgi:hypothetical protein